MYAAHQELFDIAKRIRYLILKSTTHAGSGHVTSSMSAVDLMTVLFFKYFRSDTNKPYKLNNDRFILSKGHASPLLYALYTVAGVLTENELLTLRSFGSPLEGHPIPRFPYTDIASGSLGQGLSIGVGEALGLCRIFSSEKTKYNSALPRVYVLLGDGEMAEGQVWESLAIASKYKLDNLTAIVDMNCLGQSGETMHGFDPNGYRRKLEAFGWGVITINGHDYSQITTAFEKVIQYSSGPTVIIAETIKGKGVSFMENKKDLHGVVLSKKQFLLAVKELGPIKNVKGVIKKPSINVSRALPKAIKKLKTNYIKYHKNDRVSTRKAFGNSLHRLANKFPHFLVIDGDVKNSTYTSVFESVNPDRFYQMFITEQNMVSSAVGLAVMGYESWVCTFSAFLTRAYDQIRMAAYSGKTIRLCGSHAGVSVGQDGPSQMGLTDLSMMRSVPGSTVICPADAFATDKLVEELMLIKAISYIRTNRPDTPIIYSENDRFPIGGSKVHQIKTQKRFKIQILNPIKKNKIIEKKVKKPIGIIAAGITVLEALEAQKRLAKEGILSIVMDCYSIKPIDIKGIQKIASQCFGLVIAEDHFPEGGLGEAVLTALNQGDNFHILVIHLAVRKIPCSGSPSELLEYEEIDSKAILNAVNKLYQK